MPKTNLTLTEAEHAYGKMHKTRSYLPTWADLSDRQRNAFARTKRKEVEAQRKHDLKVQRALKALRQEQEHIAIDTEHVLGSIYRAHNPDTQPSPKISVEPLGHRFRGTDIVPASMSNLDYAARANHWFNSGGAIDRRFKRRA